MIEHDRSHHYLKVAPQTKQDGLWMSVKIEGIVNSGGSHEFGNIYSG